MVDLSSKEGKVRKVPYYSSRERERERERERKRESTFGVTTSGKLFVAGGNRSPRSCEMYNISTNESRLEIIN